MHACTHACMHARAGARIVVKFYNCTIVHFSSFAQPQSKCLLLFLMPDINKPERTLNRIDKKAVLSDD
jgi:hypothetical protein